MLALLFAVASASVRMRREIRTLTAEELDAYLLADRIVRNTTQADGVARYGQHFRSHPYLLYKHATAVMNPCIDQGHANSNFIIFHQAVMLEWELSVLAVVAVERPGSTLTGVPYWNWQIDYQGHGDHVHSSLWKHWGSPFGDPENDYCIVDEVYQHKIYSVEEVTEMLEPAVPGFNAGLQTAFGGPATPFANGYGLARSPWNPSKCAGIARNPGWMFGGPTEMRPANGMTVSDCDRADSYMAWSDCVNLGITPTSAGLHGIAHTYMGTFGDDNLEVALFIPLLFFLLVLMLNVVPFCVVSLAMRSKRCAARVGGCCAKVQCFSLGFALFLVGVSMVLTPAWHLDVSLGPDGVHTPREMLGLVTAGLFAPIEWEKGSMVCPEAGACDSDTPMEECTCSFDSSSLTPLVYRGGSWSGLTDSWDVATSPHELWFAAKHELYDLMYMLWARQMDEYPSAANRFGGLPAEGECGNMATGSGINDAVNEKFCFSASDFDANVAATDGAGFKPSWSINPGEPCLTLGDVAGYLLDRESPPYTYDVLAETHSWRAVEPAESCGAWTAECSNTYLEGAVQCVQNVDRAGVGTLHGAVVADELCVAATGRAKPAPPVRVCECAHLQLEHKTKEHRAAVGQGVGAGIVAITVVGALTLLGGVVALVGHCRGKWNLVGLVRRVFGMDGAVYSDPKPAPEPLPLPAVMPRGDLP